MNSNISLDQLATLPVPAATQTWYPLPHSHVRNTVVQALEGAYKITEEKACVSEGGARYFGLLTLQSEYNDYSLAIGIRNSHDKRFPAGLALGSKVMVCTNLAFSSEVVFARRHTRWIERDLPNVVARAVGQLSELRQKQETRIETYKNRDVGRLEAHDLIIQAFDAKVLPNAKLPDVLEQWRTPNHSEFKPRNAWSLFNAFTEVLKPYAETDLQRRSLALHGVMDTFCGVN